MHSKIMLKYPRNVSRYSNFNETMNEIKNLIDRLEIEKDILISLKTSMKITDETTHEQKRTVEEYTYFIHENHLKFIKLLTTEEYIRQNIEKINEEILHVKKIIDKFNYEIKSGKMGENMRKMTILSPTEKMMIETWTQKKIGEILFDSFIDDWSLNSSTFYKHVIGKNKLVFLVEDVDCNRFGSYIHSKVSEINQWIRDDNGFLFSLYCGGADMKSKRHELKDPFYAFKVYKNKEIYLCSLGNEIFISKNNSSQECYIEGMNEYSNRLKELKPNNETFKEFFETKRFTVIQMV